jgi:hypothetical protein
MRNRVLHDALREFALEAAALLCDDQRAGAELQFDVEEGSVRGRPALYRYRPLTERYIGERWQRLRDLDSCARAAEALGAGAAAYLRVNGLRGEQAEPALQAMLERLYEDATSFGFPEERFDRVYADVERTLYRDAVRGVVLAPLHGLWLEPGRVELGDGLALVRGETAEAPPEAVWPAESTDGEPAALCVLERDVTPSDPLPADEARERFRELVAGLRLFKAGGVALGALGWRRTGDGRWGPVELGGTGVAPDDPWVLAADEAEELPDFLAVLQEKRGRGPVAWALERFLMGCGRPRVQEALSDHLLALRALLDATGETGQASMSLRLAALCAEDGERRGVQRRVEQALSLERSLMSGRSGDSASSDSPRALAYEIEGYARALLRDVLCGHLRPDLDRLADDILLEAPEARPVPEPPLPPPEPPPPEPEIRARDMRFAREREREPAPRAEEGPLDGVTASADWDDYSAPV